MAQEPVANWGSALKVQFLLGAVCFFSGAAMMVIEITGIRLLAPIFGNSLYTWTALIGVVLIAFSVGGYMGGWLADKSPHMFVLGSLLAAAAVSTLLIPAIHTLLATAFRQFGLVEGPVLLSLLLFTIPGCMLGAVSPFTVRLLAKHSGDKRIGAAAGFVGMAGSLGSFIGTFATGFVLIPHFGVTLIFIVTALLLLVLTVLVLVAFRAKLDRRLLVTLAVSTVVAVAFFLLKPKAIQQNVIFSQQTYYHLIKVMEQAAGGGHTLRYLQLDTTTEGGQNVQTGELTVAYQHYWQLAKQLESGVSRALFLGAGAFGMPEHVAAQWPHASVDVVEIDPEVIQVGMDYFNLGKYKNIKSHAMDARRFVNTTNQTYDYIFADAYNGVRYIPAHLTTTEFFQTVRQRLSSEGIFMMNIISAVTGERADLFQAIHTTLSNVFDYVEVFSTSPNNTSWATNVVILASQRGLSRFFDDGSVNGQLATLMSSRIDPQDYIYESQIILTDNHNPIEYIVAKQLRR